MRVGVMGGTFDPIHVGHLIAAEETRCELKLDRVLFLPTGQPPHKDETDVTSTLHRVRMVELAIASNPFFEISLVDAERAGKSYTVDTLQLLKDRWGPEASLFFIIGMDSLAELMTWRDPAGIIRESRLAVVNRPPYLPVDLQLMEGRLPGVSKRVDLVRMPGIDVSSTVLRERVRLGLSIRYQVTEPVERYILEKGLYR